ncbi:DUF1569 domain-containing protein [Polaribacter sp. SA4-12]|uniref:DUF1569 domain-containing protein n=1 Tax=Polaribacter sp. SA4-12 TaxID=1312072 RepID=UPI000B3C9D49|nr:DUF1569 domain-containing protein [Polaribacter sp. SA4-12]ARV16065.1 DUF1569 domain-containing protein [Polaribacter sp. SA4-12]
MKTVNTSTLENRLKTLESYIPHSKSVDVTISKADVAWHLDHSLKVLNAVAKSMETSDPTLFRNNFTFIGKICLKIGFFPRGKAKAPKYVKPPEVILDSAIVSQLAEARQHIKGINNLEDNAYFRHPLFGHINKKRVFRFMDTHTKHHLKIVKSILKK